MEDFENFADVLAEVIAQASGDVADSVMVEKAARESLGQLLNSYPQYAGGNGVQLPGPMSGSYEDGFEETGADMNGISGYSANAEQIVGVQMPGSTQDEPGFVFGKDLRGMAVPQEVPPSNQHMGVESDMGHLGGPHGDEPQMTLIGNVSVGSGQDFHTPLASDIVPVFERLRDKFGAVGNAGVREGIPGASMAGLPLAPGSGVLGGSSSYAGDGDGE